MKFAVADVDTTRGWHCGCNGPVCCLPALALAVQVMEKGIDLAVAETLAGVNQNRLMVILTGV